VAEEIDAQEIESAYVYVLPAGCVAGEVIVQLALSDALSAAFADVETAIIKRSTAIVAAAAWVQRLSSVWLRRIAASGEGQNIGGVDLSLSGGKEGRGRLPQVRFGKLYGAEPMRPDCAISSLHYPLISAKVVQAKVRGEVGEVISGHLGSFDRDEAIRSERGLPALPTRLCTCGA
jgi:hypothetical protein